MLHRLDDEPVALQANFCARGRRQSLDVATDQRRPVVANQSIPLVELH